MAPKEKWPERLLEWPSAYIELPIERISEFPLLAACLEAWRADSGAGFPSTLDPIDLPREVIKGVSLLDWVEDRQDWVIRLSSTLLDEGYGRSMRGMGINGVFRQVEAAEVRDAVSAIVGAGRPNLMRREYMDPRGRVWSYVRLILPLSSDGRSLNRYALVYDPITFGERIDR